MEIIEKIECTFCSKMYEVIVHDDESERVQWCSYCGEMIELSEEDEDDNWDRLFSCGNRLFINKSSNNRMSW